MSRPFFKALVGGPGLSALGVLALVGTLLGACSDSSSNAQPAPGVAQCPATLADAIDTACTRAGEDCGIGYACGNVPQQAHCVCTAGKYACTDSTGAAVAKGAPPACIAPGQPNDKECPTAESGTEGKACKTAGLLCSYIGLQCPEKPAPNLDTCQCEVAANGGGLFFHCEPKVCIPRSDASDDAFSAPDTSKDAPADG